MVMINKLERILSRVFTALLLIVIIAVAGLYLWVITGPRDLSAQIPYIEKSLNDVLNGNKVKIASLQISWGGVEDQLQIEAKNASLYDKNGDSLGTIATLDLEYDILPLLVGQLVPSKLKIQEADLTIPKDLFKASEKKETEQGALPEVSGLEEISIIKSRLLFEGYVDDFMIDYAKLVFAEEAANFSSMVSIKGFEPTTIDGNIISQDGNIILYGNVKNLEFAKYSAFLPELAGANLDSNMQFVVSLANAEVAQIEAKIYDIKGTISNEFLRDELQITSGEIQAVYSFANREIKIPKIDLAFVDGTKIAANGFLIDGNGIQVDAIVENLKATDLVKYWPANVAENAIVWINEHIKGGTISKGEISFKLSNEDYIAGNIPEDSLSMKFDYDDLSVDYLPNRLLPAKEIYGSGSMNANSVILGAARGEVGGSYIQETEIKITGLSEDRIEDVVMKGKISGPAVDVADFYDVLAKGKKYFSKEDLLKGTAITYVELAFPLDKDLLMDDVVFDIKSKVSDAALKNFMGGLDTKDFNMDLVTNSDGTVVKGSFVASKKTNTEAFSLKNMITAFDLKIKGGVETMEVVADMQASEIKIEPLALHKKVGQPAKLTLKKTAGVGYSKISKIQLESSLMNLVASADGDFSDIKKLNITKFDFTNSEQFSDLKGSVNMAQKNSYTAKLSSSFFNLEPILDYLDKEEESGSDDLSINLDMFVAKLGLQNNQALNNAKIKLQCIGGECENVSLKADQFDLSLVQDNLRVRAGNTALLLKGFDIYDYMQDGELEVNAVKKDGLYSGDIAIRDFRIVKGNILTKVLTVGSLTAMADTLAGKGMLFKKLSANFVETENNIEIIDFRMYGNAVGVTANGWIDTKNDIIEIKGNIIPAYTANTILGKIPILGDIIIGDEGIFAIAYSVKGKIADPDVAVNPLSVLAPGVIKNVFN